MNNLSLLDCTLRDGGYINDWNFGRKNLTSVFERLVDSGTDFIEVGFLNASVPFDPERSIQPDSRSYDRIFGALDKKNTRVVGMIDFGTCPLLNLTDASESFLDGIRVIFKESKMEPALEFCRQVKEKGYLVFAQLVSVTTYSDEKLRLLSEIVNDVRPYAVSIVDTYSLLDSVRLLKTFAILDKYIDPEIGIGFHGHNNFQLAYANSIAFMSADRHHDIIVDGTLYGMGKNAGNAPLELLAMTMNEQYGKHYDPDAMLEAVNESILPIFQKKPWGYQPTFYLTAKNRCHPNYLTDYVHEENLSVSMLDELLGKIEPDGKKLLYDKEVSRKCYDEYIKTHCLDEATKKALRDYIGEKPMLIIGPGKSVSAEKEKIDRCIKEKDPIVFSLNQIPETILPDCVFITNPKRYHDMTLDLKDERNLRVKTLATTNVTARNGQFDFLVNRAPLLEKDEAIIDNSFLMFLRLMAEIGIKEIYCAGFDGYSEKDDNYLHPEMAYDFVRSEAENLTRHMKAAVEKFRKTLNIIFVTKSLYDNRED